MADTVTEQTFETDVLVANNAYELSRSEERRVGKECAT